MYLVHLVNYLIRLIDYYQNNIYLVCSLILSFRIDVASIETMVTPAIDNAIIVASLHFPIYHILCKLGTTLSVTYANILSVSTYY